MTNDTKLTWTEVLQEDRREAGEEVLIRDFGMATPASSWAEERTPETWTLQAYTLDDGTEGRGMRFHEQVEPGGEPKKYPPSFFVDPQLEGHYAIFVSLNRLEFAGAIRVRLGTGPWFTISPAERELIRPDNTKRKVIADGPNEIELECFYTVADLTGCKLEFTMPFNQSGNEVRHTCQRAWSSLTALRFVALTDAQVKDYHDDLANPEHRRILLNAEMYSSLTQLYDWAAIWTQSDLWCVQVDIAAGSGGNCYPGSTLEEMFGENITEEQIPSLPEWIFAKTLRDMVSKGENPFNELARILHEGDVLLMASHRMSLYWGDEETNPDKWGRDSLDRYPVLFNGRFYRDHPELRQPKCRHLDYFYPEVRTFNLDRLSEALELLDVDGFNLDFTRWPPFIREDADPQIMVDFIKDARVRVDAASKVKGRKLLLSVNLVDGAHSMLTLTEQGVDIEAWLESGALDFLVIEQTNIPCYDYPPERKLDWYLALEEKYGIPIYPRQDCFMPDMDEPCGAYGLQSWILDDDGTLADMEEAEPVREPRCGPLHFEKRMKKLYEMGADKVLLSNAWHGRLTNRRLGHVDEVNERAAKNEIFGHTLGKGLSWK